MTFFTSLVFNRRWVEVEVKSCGFQTLQQHTAAVRPYANSEKRQIGLYFCTVSIRRIVVLYGVPNKVMLATINYLF
jgi:hypothetical protein